MTQTTAPKDRKEDVMTQTTTRARFWWLVQLVTWPLYQIGITTPTAWALGHRWAGTAEERADGR